MSRGVRAICLLAVASVVWGCSGSSVPFVGSWVEHQPSGTTFLWVIEESDDGYLASVYADQVEWCDNGPYQGHYQAELVDETTMRYTSITNQCYGGEEFSISDITGSLIFDSETDTLHDAGDPEAWRYQRDSSVNPTDLYPGA